MKIYPPASLLLSILATLFVSCVPESRPPDLGSQLFSQIQIIGTRGTGVGELNKPRSVAVDRADNLYVVDLTGRVQKFSPDGAYLLQWQMPQTDKGKPKGMTRDQDGHIVVLEPHYSRVNHYTTNGILQTQWGSPGTNSGQLGLPRAVAVAPDGSTYVSEFGQRERIQKFRGTKHVRSWGEPGDGPGQFNRAEGLALDKEGNVYVADSCNHRIQIFNPDGAWLKTYGTAGSEAGQLSYPYDIQIDRRGYQYVCEFGNSRIQIFDPAGKAIEIIGGPGSAPGRFNNPWSIALDSRGNLYVADANNHRVQKLVRKQT